MTSKLYFERKKKQTKNGFFPTSSVFLSTVYKKQQTKTKNKTNKVFRYATGCSFRHLFADLSANNDDGNKVRIKDEKIGRYNGTKKGRE